VVFSMRGRARERRKEKEDGNREIIESKGGGG
jgi:hypothetical protein